MKVYQEKLKGEVVWFVRMPDRALVLSRKGKPLKKYRDHLQAIVDNVHMAVAYRAVVKDGTAVLTDLILGDKIMNSYTPPLLRRRMMQNHLSLIKKHGDFRLLEFYLVTDQASRDVAIDKLPEEYDELTLKELENITVDIWGK